MIASRLRLVENLIKARNPRIQKIPHRVNNKLEMLNRFLLRVMARCGEKFSRN